MNENVQTIKIDDKGKYILVVRFPDVDSMRDAHSGLLDAQDELNQWWKSGEKFFIVAHSEDSLLDLKFERVENVASE